MASPFLPLAPDNFSGRKLGKYEIVCRLSTGGMSEIFLAFQRGVGGFRKYCVLKQILPDIKGEEEFVRMFLDEAKITAAFNHPNIAHVYDLDIDDGELFLAMEFVPGATLVEVARMCRLNNEPIPIGLALQSVRDTALALHYAHTFTDPLGNPQSVIHRDIAEKNIMVTYEGVTKLLDFGIAKSLATAGRTMVGMVKGTSGYMSPEQILGEKLDGRSDLFSLGVVLHECLTGMRLFHSKNPEQGMLAPLREAVAPPSKQNPKVTPAIDAVVLKALKRSRDERHATALEFARELEEASRDVIWRPEESAPFIQRLFSERREQTRKLLSNVSDEGREVTGEVRLKALLQGDSGPQKPPTPRPAPAPVLPPEPSTDSTDPNRQVDRKEILSPPTPARKPSLAAVPTPKGGGIGRTTGPVANPRTPTKPTPSRRDSESTAPLGHRALNTPAPPVPPAAPPDFDEVSYQVVDDGPRHDSDDEPADPVTILNRPEALMQFLDPSVRRQLEAAKRSPTGPVPFPEERTVDVRPAIDPPPTNVFPAGKQPAPIDNFAEEESGDLQTVVQDQDTEEPEPVTRSRALPRADTGEHDTVSSIAPRGSRKRRLVLIAAAVLATVVGGAALWKLATSTPADEPMRPVPEDVLSQKPGPQPKPEEKKVEPLAPPEEKKTEAVAAEKPALDAGALAEAPKLEEPPKQEAPKEAPPPKKVEEVKKKPVEKKPPPKKVVQKQPPPEKKEEKPESKATGQLTLVTTPWAKVQFKAQDLGVTPLFKVPLPIGKHTLKLTGPDNQVIMLPVEIKEGSVTTVRHKLAELTSAN